MAVRAAFYGALKEAFRTADIPWEKCEYEDRGDGALVLGPAELPKGPFIEGLPGALLAALAEHNRTNRPQRRVRLRMALHAGEINYDEHGVTSTAINLAFRLLDAEPLKAELAGSPDALAVIVSSWFFDEVVRHSDGLDQDDFTPVQAKVKETDVGAWLYLPRPAPAGRPATPGPAPRPTAVGPRLLGRDQELARLRRAADTARTGRFTLALITGEPGIGKSFLAGALRRQLAAEGWTVAWGSCPDRDGCSPGQPWTEVLQCLVGRFSREDEAELAPLLDDHATLRAAGDVPAARFRLRTAVSHLLGAVGRDDPLLVVLDDLHQADGEGLALLAHVAEDLDDVPVLLVGTYRSTEVGELLAETLATLARHGPEEIGLTGLDVGGVADLLGELCTRALTGETVAAIARRTEGNPFFVREIARLLENDGEHAAVGEVPPSVRHIVRRRVGRLPAEAQGLLRLAAVIGPEFSLDVLAEVSDLDEESLLACVDAALEAGLLVEPAQDRSLRFAHALVSETLYHDLSRLRRTGLHARVGAALERLRPGDAVALAHHFNAAQAPEAAAKAARYLWLAAEQAERRYAYREAAGFWQQAVLSHAHAPDAAASDRFELVIGSIRTLATAGELKSARDARADALAEVVGLGDAELTARVIVAYEAQGLWPQHGYGVVDERIVDLIDHTLTQLPAALVDLRCRLLACLAVELEQADDPRGEAASQEAVALARRFEDPTLLAAALNARFRRSYWTADLAERETIGAELLSLGREHRLVSVEATGRQALIRCASGRGDFAASDEHAAQLDHLATTYELSNSSAIVAWYRGLRHTVDGRFDAAARAYQQAAELTRQAGMGDIEHGAFPIASLCLAVWTGKLADQVEPCRLVHQRWPVVGAEAYALALAAAGRIEEARAVAAPRRPVPRDIRFKIVMALRGRVGLMLNDQDRIEEAYETLRPVADEVAGGESGGYAVLFPIAQLLGDLALRRRLPLAAVTHYGTATEVATRARVPAWVTAAREARARALAEHRPRRAW
ncbi:ATP-binding protein [Actinophytocola xanthii]|uniref:Orc1-like AAA ATPase domain-containing protein n=1 Tax=Actinophytocola xanthii TaxID=1912961 RepID=A0A1Q8C2L0_9PSEU|nr:AAA family ATPase [Actinophytocola xanthii]OLF08589.1 hypothetical protein BU204_34110 [Actinophytocola xanthii]